MALLHLAFVLTACLSVAGNHGTADPPILAQVGETVDLPFVFGGSNLKNQTFDCQRVDEDFTDSNTNVFSIRRGEENFEPQSEPYRDRVFLNYTLLSSGIVILKLLAVKESDSGTYLLTIPKLNRTLSLMLAVTKAEMKIKDGKGFSTTTPEGKKDEARKHYCWFAVIPLAVIIVIVVVVLLKNRRRNPRGKVESTSYEMESKAKDSIDVRMLPV